MEQYEERVLRITKRQLLRIHRAQPVLTEGLLLASESDQTMPHKISMDFIIDLCRFSQKMKWLCEWGPETIDEINRSPSNDPAEFITQKGLELYREDRSRDNCLPRAQMLALLQDSSQNWDRIILGSYDPLFFTFLHLHPCDELRLDFDDVKLTRDDIHNIAKCTNLRLIDFGLNIVPFKYMQALQRLPDLEVLNGLRPDSPMDNIRALMRFPRLKNLEVPIPEYLHRNDLPNVVSYIEGRQALARQVLVIFTDQLDIYHALSKCTQLQSINLDELDTPEVNNAHVLFSSPAIQKSVQHVRMGANARSRTFSLLQNCKNIRWLEFSRADITTVELSAIIQANAHHMSTLKLFGCYNVGDALLEDIAGCRSLVNVDLEETGVSLEAVEAYRAAKRRNWQALTYTENTGSTWPVVPGVYEAEPEEEDWEELDSTEETESEVD